MKKILLTIVGAIAAVCCFAQAPTPQCNFLYDNGDGTITLRSIGSGKTKERAQEAACKNAVRDVLFNGIEIPDNPHLSKPLINDMDSRTRYENFWDAFFKDGGVYKNFVNIQDRRSGSTVKNTTKNEKTVQMTVRVLRGDLKAYLKENNIIKY